MAIRSIEIAPLGYARLGGAFYHVIIFFGLLPRPASQSLVLLALFSNLISLAVEAVSKVFLLLVLPTLESAQYPQAFGPQPVPMLANLALRYHEIFFNIAPLFFGGICLVNEYLIFKAGYFPNSFLEQFRGWCTGLASSL